MKNGPKPKGLKKPAQREAAAEEKTRIYLSQSDVPSYGLEDALEVAEAIVDEYGSAATKPLLVAQAMKVQPTSSNFRQKCGAAIAYGLTEGGYNAVAISLQPLAKRILRPTIEGDEIIAKREAFLKPRIIGLFLTKYDNSKFPRNDIAMNVLADMGVPEDAKERVLRLILDGAKSLGFIADINGSSYVNLQGTTAIPATPPAESNGEVSAGTPTTTIAAEVEKTAIQLPSPQGPSHARVDYRRKRVFITHGKEKAFLDPIKKLLGFGELEPVVSIEKQTVSLSIPEKVMNDMRSCGAAIIHVDAELRLIDQQTNEHIVLNSNVLIEIGAAMALYGRRFILLVRDGVKLPSNLQGLYEVRYSGDALDGTATIKLLEAINDIKNHALPE